MENDGLCNTNTSKPRRSFPADRLPACPWHGAFATQRHRLEGAPRVWRPRGPATPPLTTRWFSGEIHEHSCLRCPLLRPDPAQRPRLVEIRHNLAERIAEAQRNRWVGEVEGLKVSLAAAHTKLAQVDGLVARRQASLQGTPSFSEVAARTTTTTSPARATKEP